MPCAFPDLKTRAFILSDNLPALAKDKNYNMELTYLNFWDIDILIYVDRAILRRRVAVGANQTGK